MAYQKFLSKIAIKQTFSILLMMICLILIFLKSESFAWLIFHKPEYKGKIIDAETQEPIEGVVVVTLYNTRSIIGGPGGQVYDRIHLKEVMTDKNGEFQIPSYTTMMGPNSKERHTDFIIYKPGYASYPNYQSMIVPFNLCGPEYLFTKEVGSTGIIKKKTKSVSIIYGIAEMSKLSTWEERLMAKPARPTDSTPEELPLLNEILKKEHEWLWKNEGWRR